MEQKIKDWFFTNLNLGLVLVGLTMVCLGLFGTFCDRGMHIPIYTSHTNTWIPVLLGRMGALAIVGLGIFIGYVSLRDEFESWQKHSL